MLTFFILTKKKKDKKKTTFKCSIIYKKILKTFLRMLRNGSKLDIFDKMFPNENFRRDPRCIFRSTDIQGAPNKIRVKFFNCAFLEKKVGTSFAQNGDRRIQHLTAYPFGPANNSSCSSSNFHDLFLQPY